MDSNPPQWVALAVVQSYNPRRKVPRSKISIPDLESCLSKASFSAAQSSGKYLQSKGVVFYVLVFVNLDSDETSHVTLFCLILKLQSTCHVLGIKMHQIVQNGTPSNAFYENMLLFMA